MTANPGGGEWFSIVGKRERKWKIAKTPPQRQKLRKIAGGGQFHEPCCQNYSSSSIQIELEETLTSSSLCLQVGWLQSSGHHSSRGDIPRTAGSASSLGFRSEKPIRQLKSNNDPPLNTQREECDEEFVQEARSICWQCLWGCWPLWVLPTELQCRLSPPQTCSEVGTVSVHTAVSACT